MLKLGYDSLDEVPENLRALCSANGGEVLLDDTKLKTAIDVQNALDARDHEKNDHKATKEKLSAWLKLGKSADEVQTILDEYPSLKDGGKSNEDYLNEKKQHLATQRELEGLKTKYAETEKQVSELQSYKTSGIRSAKWKEIRERLGQKYDLNQLDMLYEDIEDKLQLDEIGEFAQYKGKSVEEFFANRAERSGWAIRNKPGESRPGVDRIPPNLPKPNLPAGGAGDGFLDEDVAEKLDS